LFLYLYIEQTLFIFVSVFVMDYLCLLKIIKND